ncbi:uncharacterized protein LOC143299944 [Babylonia areolata]|uniref:uncharacterized protein LOC143299944 n=1 Tax=Babylonia areolata TaxID=304850 RepID=UPI003FD4E083
MFGGRNLQGEALQNSVGSEPGHENIHVAETQLLSRLLSSETEKVFLEKQMNSHEQLFSQERRQLQQREVHLQARCEDLENSNRTLSQQLAGMESKQLTQGTQQQEPQDKTSETCYPPRESHHSIGLQTGESCLQAEKAACVEEPTPNSSQEKMVDSWLKEKEELTQKISDVQALLVAQQEENVNHQEQEATLEGQCVLLGAQIKDAKEENETLLKNICAQQETEKELKLKCSLMADKIEAMSDYQEIAQSRGDMQQVCSSLEAQLALSQQSLSSLREENNSLSKEIHAVNTHCREMKQTVQHLQDIESGYKTLEAKLNILQGKERHSVQYAQSAVQVSSADFHDTECSVAKTPKDSDTLTESDVKRLEDKVETLKGENEFLHEKISILEENSKLLQNQSQTIQVRNRLLEYQAEAHNSRCEILQADLQQVKDNLQDAETLNKCLQDQSQALESSREKCAQLEKDNSLLSEELACLKEADTSLQADCKVLEEKCQALQEELLEATQSGQSLREQLHEQSMTLEHVISEMREVSPKGMMNPEYADGEQDVIEKADHFWPSETVPHRIEADLRRQLSKLEQVVMEKDSLIEELKEQMTAMSLQQAAMGSPPALRESAKDLEQEVQDLREEVMEKEGVIQELQEQHQCLQQSQVELKRKIKEDSDLEQEVSILHQALFEKEKLIQELKETSKLLQLSQQEKPSTASRHSSGGKGLALGADRQDGAVSREGNRSQLLGYEYQERKVDTISSRSMESQESIAISSDPESEVGPGQDMDIVKEMGRLRKDIKKTKAVYANESALFQEALDREPVSHLGLRNSSSPSSTVDFSEMTQNDIPDDPQQLKKIVVKLLDENKCMTTENLRLQLRIREQEALVLEMEGKLQNIKHPPDDWQPLFERQLLLLQKQRDELQHLICERDTGVGLLSGNAGKESVDAAALQQQQEDLTMKIGELEHCHRLLQQRQAELAHCQAEKRHLEQILLLKDETERQLMRQKRLLEEELSTIEGKLQDREAALVEEKARLLKELREKDQHIFHLQSSQVAGQPQQRRSQPQSVLMAGPQNASTPCLSKKFEASQAFFLQPLSPQEQDPSLLHKPEDEALGGSFLEEPAEDPLSGDFPPRSSSFTKEEAKAGAAAPLGEGQRVSRRHSTGTLGSGRLSPTVTRMPRDPNEMYKFHREAVDRLREKLRAQMEEEMAQLSEGQASAITGYWQRHGNSQS